MIIDPNKGSGRPGSLRWHILHIMQCESFEEVNKYFQSVTKKKVRIPLAWGKTLAAKQMKEFLDDNKSK